MADPVTAVSVDLDDLDCYHAVHGVRGVARPLALVRWLPRFLELFERLRVRATFFVIGHDLEADLERDGEGAEVLREAVRAGHELANHSYAHAYDMSTWSGDRVHTDVLRCDALLRSLGAEPVGFRAPGYTHGPAMLQAVARAGYRYDSSALPSPAYYAGKLGVMAWMAARGRSSSSVARGVRSFLGPRTPYRRTDADLVELPMSVTPWTRLPIIGTSVLSGPELLRRTVTRQALALPHLHLELHAIDLADARRDAIEADLPELREPLATREARLTALLRARGPTSRLDEVAASLPR